MASVAVCKSWLGSAKGWEMRTNLSKLYKKPMALYPLHSQNWTSGFLQGKCHRLEYLLYSQNIG